MVRYYLALNLFWVIDWVGPNSKVPSWRGKSSTVIKVSQKWDCNVGGDVLFSCEGVALGASVLTYFHDFRKYLQGDKARDFGKGTH